MGLWQKQLPGWVPGEGPNGEGGSDVNREGFRLAANDPHAKENRNRIAQERYRVDNRGTFSATAAHQDKANTADYGAADSTRMQQDSLVNGLTMRAQGKGAPSAAQNQMMSNTQASLRAQEALAKTGGVQGNAGARTAAWNKAGIAARGAQDLNQLKNQERWQAQDQLQNVLSGMADQELGNQLFNSQMTQQQQMRNAASGQQIGLANQNAQLSQTGANNAMDRFLMGQQLGMSSNQFQLQQQAEQAYQQNLQSQAGLSHGISIQNAQNQMSAIGAGFGAVGAGVAGASKYAGGGGGNQTWDSGGAPIQVDSPAQWDQWSSDKRLKKNIHKQSEDFMDNLDPYEFEYKDKEKGEGKWLGIMAGDAMKSRLGKTLVSKDQDGFMQLDVKKTLSATLAGIANLNERLNQLEKKKKK